ncbi:MAG TPA: hypothetical protein VF651_08580 [Gammaproteobacteria bacterium]
MKASRAILAALLLAGCAGAPAPAQGPVLVKGVLYGHLDKGRYHDMRDWFGVTTPVAPLDPAYRNLSLTEEYHPNLSYASFMPLDRPGEYYRAYVEEFSSDGRSTPDIGRVADGAMRFFARQMVAARGEPMQLVEERPWHTGATQGLLRLYTERTPMTTLTQDPQWMAEDYTAYILMYTAAREGKVAVLWMEWPVGCKACTAPPPGPPATGDDAIDKALSVDGRAAAFLDSFRFGGD